METETKQEHEERITKAYRITDAIRELENDLAHQRSFPCRYDGERTDKITIHTSGLSSPSININKTQCVKWMREHFNKSSLSKADGKHWEKDGVAYVQLHRGRYRIWVSCYEERFPTAQREEAFEKVDEVRDELFSKMKTLTEEPMNFEGDE